MSVKSNRAIMAWQTFPVYIQCLVEGVMCTESLLHTAEKYGMHQSRAPAFITTD